MQSDSLKQACEKNRQCENLENLLLKQIAKPLKKSNLFFCHSLMLSKKYELSFNVIPFQGRAF